MPEDQNIAVSTHNLYKQFKLPHERKSSIKEWAIHFKRPTYEKLQALSNINFEVKRGEFFGIVGRNGSGKSTLLKIIGGIYQPTSGQVRVNGTLTPFIELGIGFNPELTGRENIFLNGAILGLTRKEVKAKYNEIVAFSELEKFMDQKLKNYSSGMQVRLAFSIAIQAHNDILLIDEVLAVGDAAFARKCEKIFREIKKSGKTVIFVTHDMGAVQKFCDRAMMIQDSKILMIGRPREVALRYEMANAAPTATASVEDRAQRPKNPTVKLDKITVRPPKVGQKLYFGLHDEIVVDVDFTVREPQEIQLNLFLVKPDGRYFIGVNTTGDIKNFIPQKGKHRISCNLKSGQLAKGEYRVNVGVYTYPEPASFIDVLDPSYGFDTPQITLVDTSPVQNGDFFLRANWSKK